MEMQFGLPPLLIAIGGGQHSPQSEVAAVVIYVRVPSGLGEDHYLDYNLITYILRSLKPKTKTKRLTCYILISPKNLDLLKFFPIM